MNNDIFSRLCQELGYDAEDVISIRVNDHEVVILTRQTSGRMCIVTHRHGHDGSPRVSRGVPFGPRPGPYGGGRAARTPTPPDVMR
jgi:hypothetical protein